VIRRGLILALSLAAGCGGEDAQLRVSGGTPYVRCLAGEPRVPAAFEERFDAELRSLRIDDDSHEAVVFAGPGDADASTEIRAVRTLRPDFVLVLGDLGSTVARARANVRALDAIGAPVFFVAGGADRLDVLDGALAGARRVIDASRLRAIRFGDDQLVPLAGAPDGRYAIDAGACGFGRADVDALEVGHGAHRTLVSWAGPPNAPGIDGRPGGSALVARAFRRVGAQRLLYAWPREAGSRATDRAAAVLPIGGPFVDLADRSRGRPAPTRITFAAPEPHRAPSSP
jgi:hypothetical protein